MVARRFGYVGLLLAFGCGGSSVDPVPTQSTTRTTPSAEPAPVSTAAPAGSNDASVPNKPDAATSTSTRYDADGSESVSTQTLNVNTGTRRFTVTAYIPNKSGALPLVSLSPGFFQSAEGYAPYGKRLASHGIITIMRDDPSLRQQTPSVAEDLTATIDTWLPAQQAAPSGPLAGRVDMSRIGLAGHSRGGKVTLLAATSGLKGKVRAWFGLDPVDSNSLLDPGVRSKLSTIGVPTAFFGAGVSSSCAPASDNYEVLFAATPSPSVRIKGIGFGHTQFQDPSACTGCNLCTPAGTADVQITLPTAVRYMTAFFARELLGDSQVGATFQGSGAAADESARLVEISSK